MLRSRTQFLSLLINTLAVAGFGLFAFARNAGNLFVGLDGTYMLTIVQQQLPWLAYSLGFSGNALKGLGDMWYPLNSPLLLEYAIPAVLGVSGIAESPFQALAFTICAVQMFLATVILGRSLEFGRTSSIVSGWLIILLVFPFFGTPRIYPIFALIPHMTSAITDASLLIALFAWQGRAGTVSRGDLVRVVCICVLAMHLILTQPIFLPLAAATIIASCLGLLAGSASRGEVMIKLASGVVPALVLLLSGFAGFAVGIFYFSAAQFWASQFASTNYDSYAISILFQVAAHGRAGQLLFIAAFAGLIICMRSGRRSSRFAIAVLALIATIFLYGAVCWRLGWWKAPLPVYFELFLLPLYALFAVRFGEFVARLAIDRAPAIRVSPRAISFFAVACVGGAVAAVFLTALPSRSYSFPPGVTPVIETLRNRIGLSPGAEFRGRTLLLQGQATAGSVAWTDMHKADAARVATTGNDFNTTGLWGHGIPNLLDYNQTMSPAYYRAMTRLLAEPTDIQMRNIVVLRRADAKALAVLGVRYLITDGAQPAPFELIAEERTTPDELLRLYEVPNVNLGRWGVVETRTAPNFDAALSAMQDASFDPATTAILIEGDKVAIPAKLNSVESSTVRIGPDGWEVDASSAGPSLLVLPLEFSRCLTLHTDVPADPAPALVRVNALETGVLFTSRLRARVQYFTGPFKNATCRVRDASDFAAALR